MTGDVMSADHPTPLLSMQALQFIYQFTLAKGHGFSQQRLCNTHAGSAMLCGSLFPKGEGLCTQPRLFLADPVWLPMQAGHVCTGISKNTWPMPEVGPLSLVLHH